MCVCVCVCSWKREERCMSIVIFFVMDVFLSRNQQEELHICGLDFNVVVWHVYWKCRAGSSHWLYWFPFCNCQRFSLAVMNCYCIPQLSPLIAFINTVLDIISEMFREGNIKGHMDWHYHELMNSILIWLWFSIDFSMLLGTWSIRLGCWNV